MPDTIRLPERTTRAMTNPHEQSPPWGRRPLNIAVFVIALAACFALMVFWFSPAHIFDHLSMALFLSIPLSGCFLVLTGAVWNLQNPRLRRLNPPGAWATAIGVAIVLTIGVLFFAFIAAWLIFGGGASL